MTNYIIHNNLFIAPSVKKKFFTRHFHSTSCFFIYTDVNTEVEAINSDDIGKGSKKDISRVLDTKLDENKEQGKELREDLRDHIKALNKLSKCRVSDAKSRDGSFDNFIESEERKATRIHDDAYSSSNKALYEDGINHNGITQGMLAVNKSQESARVMGTNLSEEESQSITALKGLVNDIYQLRDNRFKLYDLKKANDNKTSLIDDYADVSTEAPDYTGGDD